MPATAHVTTQLLKNRFLCILLFRSWNLRPTTRSRLLLVSLAHEGSSHNFFIPWNAKPLSERCKARIGPSGRKEGRETLACRYAPGQRCTVSRLTTRTKIGVCLGLLAVAVGVALVLSPRPRPAVELRFVRYADEWTAVLNITNRGRSLIHCSGPDLSFIARSGPVSRIPISITRFDLMPRGGTQLSVLTKSMELPAKVSVECFHERLTLRRRMDFVVLNSFGIDIANTGFVVTVDLPPRPTSPSPPP